ncbi:uncharacterized protein N0V89_008488 [Didymosphaeria variabile]|uniref:Uncharacterized protein n=1 Tax=Didymosphaeria variabile TaxID=1932322 RepID=A0A9W8XFU9_9PLEO|nr:uncharacterized protein N0V89_008488 [Didymosphaeria variabile]KAJ4349869.1 hypothetical protein N0V89_008488 [Didymosphaeria variabile]
MEQRSWFQSFSPAAASHAHHPQFVEAHPEIAISIIAQGGHLEVTDHLLWADQGEDFLHADALGRHLEHTEADIEAGEPEVEEEVSAVVEMTMDTDLDAQCLAHDLDHLDEAYHIHDRPREAHRRGAVEEVEAVTEGEILPRAEAVAVALVVEGVQVTVHTVATVGVEAGAGVEGVVLPGDRNAASKIITRFHTR